MNVRSLDFAERQLQSRIEELTSEARYLRFRKRLAKLEAASGFASGAKSLLKEDTRSLYLFYERHSGEPSQVHGWPALQEVILNATIRELEHLKYTYCSIRLPASGNESSIDIAFHLIRLPVDGAPFKVPAELEHADLIFDLDPDWAELGYCLYLPRGLTLYPPIKPALPSASAQSRIFQPINSEPALPKDSGPRPDPADLYRLYNDLLVQAIFPKEEDVALSSDVPMKVNEDALNPLDNICIIYQDPYTQAQVPLFFNSNHWQPIASVAPEQLNQIGLYDRVDDLLHKADLQVLNRLQDYVGEKTLSRQALEIIKFQYEDMLQLLDRNLKSRFD
jgi:hypothetical protein